MARAGFEVGRHGTLATHSNRRSGYKQRSRPVLLTKNVAFQYVVEHFVGGCESYLQFLSDNISSVCVALCRLFPSRVSPPSLKAKQSK